jgi:hypothetical protein
LGTMSNDVEIFEECIPEGCWRLTNPNPQCSRAHVCVSTSGWFYNVTYKGWSKDETGNCGFCPEDISFGKCLPGETAVVTYPYSTYSPTSSHHPKTPYSTYKWTNGPTSSPYPTESLTSSHRPITAYPTGSPTLSPKPTHSTTPPTE